MKFYYGALKEVPDGVMVEIPDVKGCIIDGGNWDEAYNNAVDALAGCLSARGESWPEASNRENAIRKALETGVEEPFTMVPIPVDEKILASYEESARVNVSLPVSVLKQIDEYRAAHRMTRSKLIADAALIFMRESQ